MTAASSLITGTQTIGQGHETTFPQILADRLGMPNALIRLRQGDTDLIPMGGGHGSSRATYMGGTAMWRASDMIIEKGKRIAAEALEAAEADIAFADGNFAVVGTDRSYRCWTWRRGRARPGTPLDTYHAWTREHMTFPNGTHVAEVEIDRDTGLVRLARYRGRRLRRAGQPDGRGRPDARRDRAGRRPGIIGSTLYDPEIRPTVAGSFMDYAMPRADDLPPFALQFNPTRCTTNPLGVKGCGEAGAMALFPAIGNAVRDALRPLGAADFTGPAIPQRIWRALSGG